MKLSCLSCSTRYNIADEKIREKTVKIRCKSCSETILVRWPPGAEAPDPVEMVPLVEEPPAATPKIIAQTPTFEYDSDLCASFLLAASLYQAQDYTGWSAHLRRFIFHDDEWFIETFGDELGRLYWRSYQQSREALFSQFKELTSLKEIMPRFEESGDTMQHLVQRLMKREHRLATLHLTVSEDTTIPLRSWVFVDGGWRFLGEPLFLLAYKGSLQPLLSLQQDAWSAPGDFAPTLDGLKAQLVALMQAMTKWSASPVELYHRLSQCRVSERFMAEHFGASRGAKMMRSYEVMWPLAASHLLLLLVLKSELEIEAELREGPSEILRSFEVEYLRPPNAPLAVVMVHGLPLLYWVHEAGAWRYTLFLPSLVELPPTTRGLHNAMRLLQLLLSSPLVESRHLLYLLEVPNAASWFSNHFSPEVAAALATEYREGLSDGALQEIGQKIKEKERANIEADCQSAPSSREISGYQRRLLQLARRPIVVGRVDFDGYQYFSFVYVDGAWRWLGKTRAVDLFAEPSVVDPSAESYGADELERFLIDTHRRLSSLVLVGSREEFFGFLESAIKRALLPAPSAWFANHFSAELAVKLGKEYSGAPSRAEQALIDVLAEPLGVSALSKRLTSKTEKLLANAWTVHVIAGQLDARVERVGELQSLVGSLYTGAEPLDWVTHHGPHNDSTSGAWAYVDGGWRFVGAMSKVMTTPEWAAMYQRLFPANEAGLRDLFKAIARSFLSDQLFFSLLTESLRPTVAKMDWFRGLDAALTLTPLEGVEKYDAGRAQESEVLLSCCAAVIDPDDIFIEVIPTKASGLYAVNWSDLLNGSATAFVLLRFCDGAWRWLGGVVEHRKALVPQ